MECNIKSLDSKLSDLKDFRVKLDNDSAKILLNVLNSLKTTENKLKDLVIPSEIKTIQKKEVSFNDNTKFVLVIFFFVSILTIGGSIWYSNYRIEKQKSAIENDLRFIKNNLMKIEKQKWLNNFLKFQIEKNPNDTRNFIRNNPIPE